jgi:hypothetical protein
MLRKYALSPLTNGGPQPRVSSPFPGCSILMTRAHVRENHRAVRTREHAGQIENGGAFKWLHDRQALYSGFEKQMPGDCTIRRAWLGQQRNGPVLLS